MKSLALLLAASLPIAVFGQIPALRVDADPLAIRAAAEHAKPFTVAAERSAIFGSQDGSFEAWQFPVKILSHTSLEAELDGYPVPIDVNATAAGVEVTPAMTTITYSHAAFTIRQHMFAPRDENPHAIVLFEIRSARRMELRLRFRPEMLRMWPAPNYGSPNAEWFPEGYYLLHTDNPDLTGFVLMAGSRPGILAPYQERPKTYPAEFRISFDPARDDGKWFPLIVGVLPAGQSAAPDIQKLQAGVAAAWTKTSDYWHRFFDRKLTVETPDRSLNQALAWAAIAVDQGKVRFHDEVGLVAGYYQSADSARPGFGWFFGRDSLFSTYAANSYGDFALTRAVLEFLTKRQRIDGKIMHEYSQTADLLDWKSTPYFYASADATLLYIMAMEDYFDVSGDLSFVQQHWSSIKAAFNFARSHDSDHDGIYENTEGTGWVESWPGGMPHQEVYLAALDQQAAESISRLAKLTGNAQLATAAASKAAEIRTKLKQEYYQPANRFYAFSRNPNGSLDSTQSIFPAVAWWSGHLALPESTEMLTRWASAEFSTDWGTRDISAKTSFYDPISYHQGSVWPLYTGWVSLAEYRAGRPLSGYAHLMQNAAMTYTQDLGAVTELLSGQFFQPLGRSSSHQIWSSAMVTIPAVRGLFGLSYDASHRALWVNPHLPATWDHAMLRHVQLGKDEMDMTFTRLNGVLLVTASKDVCLRSGAAPDCAKELRLTLPGAELELPAALPLAGAETSQWKAVYEHVAPNEYEVWLEGIGGSMAELYVRLNAANVSVAGGRLSGGKLQVQAPAGLGYQRVRVRFTW